MKLPWNRPRSPPSAPVETWGYEDIKAWLWFLRARRFKRVFKSQSGKDLVQMDLGAVQELLGKEHMAVANRIWNSVQELQRREEGSTILNTQNYSQSLTSMSSDVSTLRDASTNQIESDFQGYKDDGNTDRMKEVETANGPLPMKQAEGQPLKVPEVEPVTGALALKEGQKENRNGMTRRENGSHSPSSKRANCRTPEKKSRVAFKSLQEIQDNFVPEQPGELESAFAVYSAHGAPYGDKRKSPREHEAKMCGSSFSLMCKSNGLVANHMGRQDVIFSEVKRKEKGAKTISFQEFELALEKLAALNHVPVHAIRTRVIEGSKEMMINRPQTPV